MDELNSSHWVKEKELELNKKLLELDSQIVTLQGKQQRIEFEAENQEEVLTRFEEQLSETTPSSSVQSSRQNSPDRSNGVGLGHRVKSAHFQVSDLENQEITLKERTRTLKAKQFEAVESFNQLQERSRMLAEQRQMAQEDLEAHGMRRADLIAHREELDLICEQVQEASGLEFNLYSRYKRQIIKQSQQDSKKDIRLDGKESNICDDQLKVQYEEQKFKSFVQQVLLQLKQVYKCQQDNQTNKKSFDEATERIRQDLDQIRLQNQADIDKFRETLLEKVAQFMSQVLSVPIEKALLIEKFQKASLEKDTIFDKKLQQVTKVGAQIYEADARARSIANMIDLELRPLISACDQSRNSVEEKIFNQKRAADVFTKKAQEAEKVLTEHRQILQKCKRRSDSKMRVSQMRSQMDFITSSHQDLTLKSKTIVDQRKVLEMQFQHEIDSKRVEQEHLQSKRENRQKILKVEQDNLQNCLAQIDDLVNQTILQQERAFEKASREQTSMALISESLQFMPKRASLTEFGTQRENVNRHKKISLNQIQSQSTSQLAALASNHHTGPTVRLQAAAGSKQNVKVQGAVSDLEYDKDSPTGHTVLHLDTDSIPLQKHTIPTFKTQITSAKDHQSRNGNNEVQMSQSSVQTVPKRIEKSIWQGIPNQISIAPLQINQNADSNNYTSNKVEIHNNLNQSSLYNVEEITPTIGLNYQPSQEIESKSAFQTVSVESKKQAEQKRTNEIPSNQSRKHEFDKKHSKNNSMPQWSPIQINQQVFKQDCGIIEPNTLVHKESYNGSIKEDTFFENLLPDMLNNDHSHQQNLLPESNQNQIHQCSFPNTQNSQQQFQQHEMSRDSLDMQQIQDHQFNHQMISQSHANMAGYSQEDLFSLQNKNNPGQTNHMNNQFDSALFPIRHSIEIDRKQAPSMYLSQTEIQPKKRISQRKKSLTNQSTKFKSNRLSENRKSRQMANFSGKNLTQNHNLNSRIPLSLLESQPNMSHDMRLALRLIPLTEGQIFYKKFSQTTSLSNKATFDPLQAEKNGPEICGFGIRLFQLTPDLKQIVIKQNLRKPVENRIKLEDILQTIVPQTTVDIIRAKKRQKNYKTLTPVEHTSYYSLDQISQVNSFGEMNMSMTHFDSVQEQLKMILDQKQTGVGKTQSVSTLANLGILDKKSSIYQQKCASSIYFPFQIAIKNGGAPIELIATSQESLENWIYGLNFLVQNKKQLLKINALLKAAETQLIPSQTQF